MSARIHRRQLLRLSSLGIASCGLAPWIERAFAAETSIQGAVVAPKRQTLSPRARVLAETWEVARDRGKPMLVFVVPAFRDGNERGRMLAAFLLDASEEAQAELALCEVACAMVSELQALLPEAGKGLKGEPMAVLVEPDGQRARAVVEWIHPLPTTDPFGPNPSKTEERNRWVESVAREFHDAIAGDRATLLRRANQALDRLSQAGRDRLTGLEARGGSWGSPDIAACPASALLAAKRDDACRGHVAELSRMSRAGLVETSPRGARWAEHWGGCGGLRLEDPREEVSSPGPCGTGFLPAESRRFLWLFTKTDP